MENEPELIRDQMQETRTALTEKLDTLQQKVADTVDSITTPVTETVQSVKEAVTDTVETVKGTVSDTVESVKDTFDLSRQIERHPWGVMLGSVATGFVLGRILPSPTKVAGTVAAATGAVASSVAEAAHGRNGAHGEPREESSSEGGMFSGLADAVQGELDKVKGLGISVGLGLLRDLMSQSLQGEIGKHVTEWMDGLTEKLRSQSPSTSSSEPNSSPPPDANGGKGRSDEEWSSSGGRRSIQETRPRW